MNVSDFTLNGWLGCRSFKVLNDDELPVESPDKLDVDLYLIMISPVIISEKARLPIIRIENKNIANFAGN
jgi:hypothetical protein